MARIKNILFTLLWILLLCFSLTACKGEAVMIPMNHDTFHNQNASTKDNHILDSQEVFNEEIETSQPEATAIPEEETVLEENFKEVEETVYATTNVKIRSHYTTKANNVIAILKTGDAIKRIGIGKEWSKVEYNNLACYISSAYLTTKEEPPTVTDKPTATPTSTPTPTPSSTPTPTFAPTPIQTPSEEPSMPSEEEAEVIITPAPTPDPDTTDAEDNTPTVTGDYSFVETLSLGKDLDKLVCVIGSGSSNCIVSYHRKDQNGQWVQIFTVDGDCGLEGITYHKREGDNKTPAGLYSFTLAFGLKTDPGAFLNYRRITEYDYWINDINSPYYNTWVNSTDTPGNYTTEHLVDHNPSFNYVLNINYNPDNTPGLGSAIFLHCYNGSGFTSGGIAIPEDHMKTLVKEVDSSTRILIVPKESDLSLY